MSPPFNFDFSDAAALTDQQLAGELSKHTIFSKTEIADLLPARADLDRLKQLIEIVNGAADQNNKLAKLSANFANLGGVALKLLGDRRSKRMTRRKPAVLDAAGGVCRWPGRGWSRPDASVTGLGHCPGEPRRAYSGPRLTEAPAVPVGQGGSAG